MRKKIGKSGTIGSTLTWIVATAIIIVLLLVFAFFSGLIAFGKGSKDAGFAFSENSVKIFRSQNLAPEIIESNSIILTKQLAVFLTRGLQEKIFSDREGFFKEASFFVYSLDDEEKCHTLCIQAGTERDGISSCGTNDLQTLIINLATHEEQVIGYRDICKELSRGGFVEFFVNEKNVFVKLIAEER